MDFYDLAKDILVPLLAPTVAAFSLIGAFYFDRRRARIARETEIENAAGAIYRDAIFLKNQYNAIMAAWYYDKKIEPERCTVAEATSKRIFKNLYVSPYVYKKYFMGFHLEIQENTINYEKLPHVLSELEIRIKNIKKTNKSDLLLMFCVELLIYAGAECKKNRDNSTNELREISKKEPEIFRRLWSESPDAALWLTEPGQNH